jgi:hypothetical protein
MPEKEAAARIKINLLLAAAGGGSCPAGNNPDNTPLKQGVKLKLSRDARLKITGQPRWGSQGDH